MRLIRSLTVLSLSLYVASTPAASAPAIAPFSRLPDMRSDEVLLYAPRYPTKPLQAWNTDDFTNVDDTVRGGKSSSKVSLDYRGELLFTGNVDITALGGAGFASQAHVHGFPLLLTTDRFDGLRLRIRKPPPAIKQVHGTATAVDQPCNITRYVINIKTEMPVVGPGGQRQSQPVWEWDVQLPCTDPKAYSSGKNATTPRLDLETDQFLTFDGRWSDFKLTFRGKPVENPREFRPDQTQEWSIMARSDFGKQSGRFLLHIHSLSAIVKGAKPTSSLLKRSLGAELDVEKSASLATAASSSGEYYGFTLFVFATVLYVLWIVWGLTPDWALQKLGVTWYPNRCVDGAAPKSIAEWAYLVPAWSLVAVLGVYAGFISLNLLNTPDLEEVVGVIDSHANVLAVPTYKRERHPLEGHDVTTTGQADGPLSNDVYDLPPGLVSRQLYLDRPE